MVSAVFDHIVAILIVGAIFVGTIVVLPTLSITSLQAVDQQQMRNTALNVFNTMLLDEGQPSDWGSFRDFQTNDSRIDRFGLSQARESTFYVLDPDKVQRLVIGNPMGCCTYEYVRRLLNLQEYGFRLRVIPPFNVTFNGPLNVVGNTLHYEVKAVYLSGDPIPNARTEATVAYTGSGQDQFGVAKSGDFFTNAIGIAKGNVTLNFTPKSWVVTARVTVADVATLVVVSSQTKNTIADVNLVYDELILTHVPYAEESNDAVWIYNIVAIDSQGTLWSLFNSTGKNVQGYKLNAGSFEQWSRVFYGLHGFHPVVLMFNFWAVDELGNGRQFCLVVAAYPNLLGTSIFEYGGTPSAGTTVVKIQRGVTFSRMTYTAELWLWKT